MRTILSAILISFLLSGCYNHYNNPEQSDNSLAAHTTISTLYPMCSVGVLTIEESLKVKGRVVSNDCDKYFNGELYIDDGTATAKLMIDQYSLYTRYPEGVEISVDLKGFAIAQKDHILQIGLPSANNKCSVISAPPVIVPVKSSFRRADCVMYPVNHPMSA